MKTIVRQGVGTRKSVAAKPIATRDAARGVPAPILFKAGAYTFTPERAGFWKICLIGGGVGGTSGGDGGAGGSYTERTEFLTPANPVSIIVGDSGQASTATFPNGRTITTGASSGTTPGTPSGGDVNLTGGVGGAGGGSGSAGSGTTGGSGGIGSGGSNGGGGAAAQLPLRGGNGGNTNASGLTPGGGGGAGATNSAGGQGIGLVFFVRA